MHVTACVCVVILSCCMHPRGPGQRSGALYDHISISSAKPCMRSQTTHFGPKPYGKWSRCRLSRPRRRWRSRAGGQNVLWGCLVSSLSFCLSFSLSGGTGGRRSGCPTRIACVRSGTGFGVDARFCFVFCALPRKREEGLVKTITLPKACFCLTITSDRLIEALGECD